MKTLTEEKAHRKPRGLRLVTTPAGTPDRLLDDAERLELEALRLRQRAHRAVVLGVARAEYTQDDRPTWARSKTAYMRACRTLADEGHDGVRKVGRVWTMTAAASEEWAARHASPRTKKPAARVDIAPVRNADDEALDALGAVRGGR